ncbi:Nephrocystin-3 [Hondaea fermentalgiana]|uniref:Nephrocystin-3 n=1 Tax=Hondaea fermentalgiana TaxID=2315210 RepID=A0A2R5GV82_9STRA|nr:Nephrocystin-3 [Hondaea fermentalgiana]|eukprot:GBG32563.1 Nephrocystin-3 [Hondaea fermentalgiana]
MDALQNATHDVQTQTQTQTQVQTKAKTLREKAEELVGQGRHAEGLEVLETALAALSTSETEEASAIVASIANVHWTEGRPKEAKSRFETLIKATTDALGEHDPAVIQTIFAAGHACAESRHFSEAAEFFHKVLRTDDLDAEMAVRATWALAKVFDEECNFDEAQKFYEKALEMEQLRTGAKDAEILLAIADLKRSQEQYDEALVCYKEVANMYRGHALDSQQAFASLSPVLHAIGGVYEAQNRADEAIVTYTELVERAKTVLGARHAQVATLLSEVAWRCLQAEYHAQALEFYAQALVIRKEDEKGLQSLSVAFTLDPMAKAYAALGRRIEEIECLDEALCIWKKNRGPRDAIVARTLQRIGQAHMALRQWERAKASLAEAFDMHPSMPGLREDVEKSEHAAAV